MESVSTQLQKATISCVLSVLPPVCPYETTWLPRDEFSWNLVFEDFSKTGRENSGWFKSDKNNPYFTWRRIYKMWQLLAEFILEWEMFQINVVEKIKTHILHSIFFFSKMVPLWDKVEKYSRATQATYDNKIRHMRSACRITKGWIQADTHELKLIQFPWHQWLGERASILRYTYIACLFKINIEEQNVVNKEDTDAHV